MSKRIALATIIKGDQYDLWFVDNVLSKMKEYFDCFLIRDSREKGWNGNFAEAKNELVRQAESLGCDWIFFMDADEAMFDADINKMLDYINREVDDIIVQPRINFVEDAQHFDDLTYPDYQGRVFKLGVGYHFRGEIHETVFKGNEPGNWHAKRSGYRAIDCPIYHYGGCKPVEEWQQKYWRAGETYLHHLYLGNHPLKKYAIYK